MNPERRIALALAASAAAALALAAVYVAGGQPQAEGALLAVNLGGLGVALALWVKDLHGGEAVVAERPSLESRPADRAEFTRSFRRGEEALERRGFLARLLLLALAATGLAALFPARSLGPAPGRALFRTAWRPGSRMVTAPGSPVRLGDLEAGSVLTVFPEGHFGEEDSATLLIRVDPAELDLGEERQGWAPEGHVAYSKICTHVGCPVGLYQQATHQVLCPCHQSTFDVLRGARPVFGPATRPLPQLPLAVEDGYLVARSDFPEPIGPAFWNIGRRRRG